MSFSNDWDRLYSKQRHLSVWPWTDLVSLVMRHCRQNAVCGRVLELGCGAGANIPFLKALEAEYFAVEGSASVVARLHEYYPDMVNSIIVGDFTESIPFDGSFDLVIDRGSLTHNCAADIKKCLSKVQEKLRPGGALVGVDWFSDKFNEIDNGRPYLDVHTRTGFSGGNLTGVGAAHFADKEHLLDLLSGFEIEVLEHKTIDRHIPFDGWRFGAWNFVAFCRN